MNFKFEVEIWPFRFKFEVKTLIQNLKLKFQLEPGSQIFKVKSVVYRMAILGGPKTVLGLAHVDGRWTTIILYKLLYLVFLILSRLGEWQGG